MPSENPIKIDSRGLLITIWLTLLIGTLTTAATMTYTRNSTDAARIFPADVSGTWAMIIGLWLAGIAAGALILLAGWARNTRDAVATVSIGYLIGAGLRCVFVYRPNLLLSWDRADASFSFLWEALTLQGFPQDDVFIVLVMLVGVAVVASITLMLSSLIRPLRGVPALTYFEGRVHAVAVLLMVVGMLSMIVVSNFGDADTYTDLTLRNTNWLTLPQTNMLLAALIGFLMGATYLAPNRESAASTLFMAGVSMVMLMWLLDPLLTIYDPARGSLDPNRVALLPYLFLWVGTPIIAAIAAFALHNLRDAFRYGTTHDPAEM